MTNKEHSITFEGLDIPKDKYQPPVKKKNSEEFYDLNSPEFPVVQDHEFKTKYWLIPHNSTSSYLRYIEEHWAYFNRTRFEGKLRKPKFAFLKDLDAMRMRLRGRFGPPSRTKYEDPGTLELSPNLFNAPHEGWINRTLIHEMCHQAVWEIDGIDAWDDEYKHGKGHGPRWMQWMRHAHLPASRFDDTKNEMYMGDDDHKRAQERKDIVKKVHEVRMKRIPVQQPKMFLPVLLLFKDKIDTPVTGILIGPVALPRGPTGYPTRERKASDSWYFIDVSDKRIYKTSLRSAFYLYPDEAKAFDTDFWKQEVTRERRRLENRELIDPGS
jgi:hypothetical protein